jgi:hypothetical protein
VPAEHNGRAGEGGTEARPAADQKKEPQRQQSRLVRVMRKPAPWLSLATATAVGTVIATLLTGVLRPAAPEPRATAEPPGLPSKTPSAAPSPGRSTGLYPGFRQLWGPEDLVIGEDTDISVIPPQSESTFGVIDLVDGDAGIIPAGGTKLALWPGSSAPTPSQCENTADNQPAVSTLTPYPGGTMCAVTSNGFVVIMQVIAVDSNPTSTETQTSIWSPVS